MIAFCNRYNVHPYTILLFLGVLAISFTAAFPVWAQSIDTLSVPADPSAIDFGPLVQSVIGFAALVLTAIAGFVGRSASKWFAARTGMDDLAAEALIASRVDDILIKAIGFAEQWAKDQVGDPRSPIRNVRIDNFFLEQAVRYAQRSMPDYIERFKLTPDRLAEMIMSRLNSVTRTPVADSGAVEMVVQ